VRLFVAAELAPAVRDRIRAALDDFPVTPPPWRWSAPDTWHITLKFIGETPPEAVAKALDALSVVASRHAPFDLVLGPFGGFPNLRAPRVLFFGADAGADACAALAREVDAALFDAVGVARETRGFHAHATVARVKDRLAPAVAARLTRVPALTQAATRVDRFVLMESRLRPAGAEYSVVKEFALSGGR